MAAAALGGAAQGLAGGNEATVHRLAAALSDFNTQLASSRSGSLAQIWMPEPGEEGGPVLNTQGLPYSINGVGDLLALFRCISCKYKFSTDVSKPQQMGAVGRVFTSGEPEMSNHVQRYDQHVYLRAAEAQRCRVHSTLFMPLYPTVARDSCLGVFEVVLTDPDVNFAGMVGWIISCLQSQGLFTAEVDTGSLGDQRLGLRQLGGADCDGVSALESGIAPRLDGGRGVVDDQGAGSMILPMVKREPNNGHGGAGGDGEARANGGDAAAAAEGGTVGGEGTAPQVELQRMASGPPLQGMPSPAPQQQQMAGGVGSGSGGGSGHLPQQPVLPAPQQQAPGQQGSHRLSASLEGRQGLVGSGGSLPNVMHGSGHHSGSGGLHSGSTAQQHLGPLPGIQGQASADPQAVAAAVAQLLQHGGLAGGVFGAPQQSQQQQQQLVALLNAHSVQQQMPMLGAGAGGNGPGALLLGPSPAVTAGHSGQPPPQPQQQQQPNGLTQQQQQQDQDEEMGDETDEEDDKPFLRPAPGAAQKYGQGNRVLTYDDLAAQFGYGLKEAASRLNICPTTLKRACRRLGVPRWPRREIVKHKKRKSTARGEGASSQQPPSQQQQQQQQNGGGTASLANGKGFSTGSGPSSGGSGNPPLHMGVGPTPHSGSLLSGLPAMDQLSQLPLGAVPGAGLAPELVAAIASNLQQQQQQAAGVGPVQALPPPNPALVSQVVALLQQQQGPGVPAAQQQQQQPGASGLPPATTGAQQQVPASTAANGHLPLPLPLPMPLPAGGGAGAGAGGMPPLPPRSSPLPPAPLLSNLGLPRRADSKLNQSVGHGMGSLDILAAADFDVSVGNMSVGNSPRIALSNLGGLSQLGLSAFDFNGVANGNGPAPTATATGGAGGATGPQNGPAISSGAVSRPPARENK